MKTLIRLFVLALIVTGCNSQNEPDITKDAEPLKLRAGLEKRVGQDNEFAFDLLKRTITESKETNVFVSPLSVSIALGMAWNGANSQTRTEMETALKMSGMSVDDINEYYKVMQSSLPHIDPTTKLSIANSLWYRTGFPIKAGFLKANTDYFNAEVRELDFSKAWAVDTINNWCSRKTNKLIPEIISEISPDAMVYLINAVYFKGMWRQKFDKKLTSEALFTSESGSKSNVNMMYQKDTFNYTTDELAQYIDMPYGNKAFSMTVILPKEGKTTADVLDNLTVEKLNSTLGAMASKQVMVYFPRFKVENKFSLNKMLAAMGMPAAFSPQLADFSNISVVKLFISDVIHKTYVTVDEEGTEAAAVTAIVMELTSMPDYPVFRVDKPFVFVIREQSTGVILFIGKIGNVVKY